MDPILNPRIWYKSYLVLTELAKSLKMSIISEIPPEKKDNVILDIGCGTKPYYKLFKHLTKSYIGIDIEKNPDIDIICDAAYLPFKDDSFTIVISTQVLEHVQKPDSVISEAYRILKKKGVVFLSTHGVWSKYGKTDYWRWTDSGLHLLFSKYSDVHVICNGGAILCFFQLINLYISVLPFGKRILWLISNILGGLFDKIYRCEKYLIINYLVTGKK